MISWCLGAGTDYTSGTLQTVWGADVSANTFAGQTANVGSSTDNDFRLTGVQLEVGSVATDFEHRSFAQEIDLCKRYYQQYPEEPNDGYGGYGVCSNTSSTQSHFIFQFPRMRSIPTVALSGNNRHISNGVVRDVTSLTMFHQTKSNIFTGVNVASGLGTGDGGAFGANNDSTAKLTLSAEL